MKSAGREGRVAGAAGAAGVAMAVDCVLAGGLAGAAGLPLGQTPQMSAMTAMMDRGHTHLGTPPPASSSSVFVLRATTVEALDNEPPTGGLTPGRRGCSPVV